MIIAYLNSKNFVPQEISLANKDILQEAIWIDLFDPLQAEIELVEKYLNLEIPTRSDMEEIETSSRLYQENSFLFMIATMFARSDTMNLKLDPVTFILTDKSLITVRYIELQSFDLFLAHRRKNDYPNDDSILLFIALLEANIDCLADIIEFTGHRLEDYSRKIFHPQTERDTPKPDYRQFLQQLGLNGDLNSKTRESLMIFNRLVSFFKQTAGARIHIAEQTRLSTLSNDVLTLSDHATFIANKVIFLLEATLGMVNIEQNNIIKIFSVAAVIFLPPTLIASFYGMNFHFIPELSWKFGYLYVIGLMLLSSWLPYRYFKYRKWL